MTGKVTTPARIDRCFYKPRWSKDGKYIYALIEQSRNTWLARIDPATDEIRYLTRVIASPSISTWRLTAGSYYSMATT